MSARRPSIRGRAARAGLTLIELLLVVLILVATALLATTALEGAEDQVRFEDTRARLERARGGILGDFEVQGSSPGVARSFVNDIGRLPRELDELIEAGTLPPFGFDPETGLWAGWRGPYVPVRRESGGLGTYRDGWGNPLEGAFGTLHGWKLFELDPAEETLWMQSFGSDGRDGGEGYAADFPPAAPGGERPPPLVMAADHRVDLRGAWVEVELVNPGAAPLDPGEVRLALVHPRSGSLAPPPWPATASERDAAPWLSERARAGTLEAGASRTLVFRFLAPGVADAEPKRVPAGARGLVLLAEGDGARIGPPQPARPVRLAPRSAPPELRMEWRLSP